MRYTVASKSIVNRKVNFLYLLSTEYILLSDQKMYLKLKTWNKTLFHGFYISMLKN